MLELRELLMASIDKLLQSGAIEKALDEAIAKTVVEVVKGQLREYSDFGKQVTKAVEKSLCIHGDINLPAYNHAIIKIIEAQVEAGTRSSIERQVAERMKKLLTPAPERIMLSTLIEQYVQHLKDKQHGGCTCYGDDIAYAKLSESESYPSFLDLTLAESREKATYGKRSGQISIGIHLRTPRDGEAPAKVGTIYSLSFASVDVEKQMFVGELHNFERSIFQMQAAKTQLEIDCDPEDCDLHFGKHEYV